MARLQNAFPMKNGLFVHVQLFESVHEERSLFTGHSKLYSRHRKLQSPFPLLVSAGERAPFIT